jgi:hypothetical protein
LLYKLHPFIFPSQEDRKVQALFPNIKTWLLGAVVSLAIAGCGGGNGADSPPAAASDTVKGLAAVGAPVTGARVELICANGVSGHTTTDDDGRWSIQLANPEYPCLVTLSDSTSHAGLVLHSLAQDKGHVNITPLTDLVLARAAGKSLSDMGSIDADTLRQLSADLLEAQEEVLSVLVDQGFPADGLQVFSGEFLPEAGDPYDDLLEHFAVSLLDGNTTYDEFLQVIAAPDDDAPPPALNNTTVLQAAALAAMPQINKASVSIEDEALKMTLQAGSNAIGAFVGGGTGNKAVVQLPGLDRMKLSDFHSMAINLQGDVAVGKPYVSLNLTIDLQCSTEADSDSATLADLAARRRILTFDTYYQFIAPTPLIDTDSYSEMVITPATKGWRVSGGTPIGTVAITPNYSGSETLTGFDYDTYPDACIVDGPTGDNGMFRNTQDSDCTTGAALATQTPAKCAVDYRGAVLALGSSTETQVSNWLVKDVKVFRHPRDEEDGARQHRTYRFK